MLKLLLASGSPRRRELLSQLTDNIEFVKLKDIEETYPNDLPPEEVPVYLSRQKATAYHTHPAPDEVLVTADTVVILDGKVIGKPTDAAQARAMLKSLAGKTHKVVTGVTLTGHDRTVSFSETTEVEFSDLNDNEIDFYVTRYNPLDKAGAYGIQEWIGYVGVRAIRGCFYNVMGMPLNRLYTELKRNFAALL